MKICFLTKIEKSGVKEAIAYTEKITKDIDVFHGDSTDPFPAKATKENYDLLISTYRVGLCPRQY